MVHLENNTFSKIEITISVGTTFLTISKQNQTQKRAWTHQEFEKVTTAKNLVTNVVFKELD